MQPHSQTLDWFAHANAAHGHFRGGGPDWLARLDNRRLLFAARLSGIMRVRYMRRARECLGRPGASHQRGILHPRIVISRRTLFKSAISRRLKTRSASPIRSRSATMAAIADEHFSDGVVLSVALADADHRGRCGSAVMNKCVSKTLHLKWLSSPERR